MREIKHYKLRLILTVISIVIMLIALSVESNLYHTFKDPEEFYKANIILITFLSFTFLGVILLFVEFLLVRFKKVREIVYHIRTKQFEKLPPLTQEHNICDEFRNELIKVGREIENYIKLLSLKLENYKKKAYIDELTQAFNRHFLDEVAHKILLKSKISHTPTSILMIDIDNFKKINDTYGHDIGDKVLKQIASILKEHLRKDDILIRYGGEEFLIILPNTSLEDSFKIAEKIRKAIESQPLHTEKGDLHFTISIGISECKVDDKDINEAIKRADKNLYKAKRNGKNRTEI